MLAAWDTARDEAVALPDFEEGADLESIRERARGGGLVCPACRALLWLRAGEVRLPHFAHRKLSDCAASRVSLAVLEARQLLYRFFRTRIESGRLPGTVELEPSMSGWPPELVLDLVVRGEGGAGVAVLLCDRGLKPELRAQWRQQVEREKWVFRPVFLSARLTFEAPARGEGLAERVLLDPTQREFRLNSPYDLRPGTGTLHFVDPGSREWITLRGLAVWHPPQSFRPAGVLRSPVADVLWSGRHAEWVHPGEAEALRAHREAQQAAQREAVRQRVEMRRAEKVARRNARREAERRAAELAERMRTRLPARETEPGETQPSVFRPTTRKAFPEEPERAPLPAWIRDGLKCVGCGRRTVDWQNADTGRDACVCKACFEKGVRLDGGQVE